VRGIGGDAARRSARSGGRKPYDRLESWVKDLPFGHRLVEMMWPSAYRCNRAVSTAAVYQTRRADRTTASADEAAAAPVVRRLFDAESASSGWITNFIDLDTGLQGLAAGLIP
jgi:hypothetical protein